MFFFFLIVGVALCFSFSLGFNTVSYGTLNVALKIMMIPIFRTWKLNLKTVYSIMSFGKNWKFLKNFLPLQIDFILHSYLPYAAV